MAPFANGIAVAINKAVDAGVLVITIIEESIEPSKRLAFIEQNVPEVSKE